MTFQGTAYPSPKTMGKNTTAPAPQTHTLTSAVADYILALSSGCWENTFAQLCVSWLEAIGNLVEIEQKGFR